MVEKGTLEGLFRDVCTMLYVHDIELSLSPYALVVAAGSLDQVLAWRLHAIRARGVRER